MKVSFEGSVEEFRKIFRVGTGVIESVDISVPSVSVPSTFEPSGEDQPHTFEVVQGGQERPVAEEPEYLDNPVAVNPLANDLPVPENDPKAGTKVDLPKLTDEERVLGWEKFKEVCVLWTKNFGETEEVEVEVLKPLRNEEGKLVDEEGKELKRGDKAVQRVELVKEERPKPQPDREGALRELGEGRCPLPVLVMAYEIGSLQRMVEQALLESEMGQGEDPNAWLDYVDQIATTMVQVSHKSFPDLAGTYDYGTRWRRVEPPALSIPRSS